MTVAQSPEQLYASIFALVNIILLVCTNRFEQPLTLTLASIKLIYFIVRIVCSWRSAPTVEQNWSALLKKSAAVRQARRAALQRACAELARPLANVDRYATVCADR